MKNVYFIVIIFIAFLLGFFFVVVVADSLNLLSNYLSLFLALSFLSLQQQTHLWHLTVIFGIIISSKQRERTESSTQWSCLVIVDYFMPFAADAAAQHNPGNIIIITL